MFSRRTNGCLLLHRDPLCEAGHARPHRQNLLPERVLEVDELAYFRPGTDQAHVAFEHIEQLWPLVDRGRAQEPSYARNPWSPGPAFPAIVRNLYISNGFPFLPMRRDL